MSSRFQVPGSKFKVESDVWNFEPCTLNFEFETVAMSIHVEQSAVVDPRAELDEDVRIGPFCVVGPKARIGRGTHLINSVTIMGRVTIGQANRIFPGAVLGGEPQDVSYRGSDTEVVIGDDNVIREG